LLSSMIWFQIMWESEWQAAAFTWCGTRIRNNWHQARPKHVFSRLSFSENLAITYLADMLSPCYEPMCANAELIVNFNWLLWTVLQLQHVHCYPRMVLIGLYQKTQLEGLLEGSIIWLWRCKAYYKAMIFIITIH